MTILVCLFLFALQGSVYAQRSVVMEKNIVDVRLDSAYVLIGRVDANSIRAFRGDTLVDRSRWRFEADRSAWLLLDSAYAGSMIMIRYETMPWIPYSVFNAKYYREVGADSASGALANPTVRNLYSRNDIFGSSSIQRSGSLTRGITFGSNRDASLESGLRLDLSGNVTDDVEILATLTDQSTPIQPDGSTQNLREFDQVFIRLRSSVGQLQLGDVDVTFDGSRYARVGRRLQGADIIARTSIGDQRATASVARGVFRSQSIAGIDGVQGPYRLAGASGETFIIVLAGTENVFLDGRRLTRGEENDYVIDYGLGEITFTNRHFINSKSRITVDFQYISQQYTRSLIAAESQARDLLGGRLDLRATVIREADGDNPNAQLLLTPSEIDVLRRAGDDPAKAVVSGVEPFRDSDDEQRVKYVRRDTLIDGQNVVFYQVDQLGLDSGYAVRFSRTDAGRGSYVRSGSTLNGTIYRWVGNGKGDYDTLRTLTAPIEKMVASLDLDYRMGDKHRIYGEIAGSRFDRNRFSPLSTTGQEGLAWTLGMAGGSSIQGSKGIRYELQHHALSSNFAFFDRPRDVEFDRIWNVADSEQVKESRSMFTAGWRPSISTDISATGGLLRRDRIQSDRIQATIRTEEPGIINLYYDGSYVHSRDSLNALAGTWQRHVGDLVKPVVLGSMVATPGIRFEHEDRDQSDMLTGDLSQNSLRFTDVHPSISFRDTAQRWTFRLSGSFRRDYLPIEGAMREESNSLTRSVGWSYDAGRRFSTEQEIGLRDVTYTEVFNIAQGREDNRSAQVRSVIRYALGGRFLEGQWNYDLRSERRAKLQERYFEVGPELGSYIWDDLNGDGIQDLDEFFPERIPGEGTFVLQFVPGDEFIPVTSLDTGLRHTLRFGEIASIGSRVSWLKRLEFTSGLSVRESSSDRLKDISAVRLGTFQGDLTQQGRLSTIHEIRLQQSGHTFGFRVIHDFSKSANRLVQGLERQGRNTLRGIGQIRISDIWSTEWQLQSGYHRNSSEVLASRGFDIRTEELRSTLYANFSRRLLGSATGAYIQRTDRLPADPVRLRAWLFEIDGTLFHGRGARSRLSIGRRVNNVSGVSTSYGLYELTDGGAPGVVWSGSIQSDYRVSDFIRASLNYDMRKFPSRPIIQTMRVVVSAVL